MENFGKTAVIRADMAGLRKYHKGGYGRNEVYRVNTTITYKKLETDVGEAYYTLNMFDSNKSIFHNPHLI